MFLFQNKHFLSSNYPILVIKALDPDWTYSAYKATLIL
jgi:hypothetical protein